MMYFQLVRITKRETNVYVLQYSQPLKLMLVVPRPVMLVEMMLVEAHFPLNGMLKLGRVFPENLF
jgi:hypothetical protein